MRVLAKCSNRFKTVVLLFTRVRFIPFCITSALCPQDNSTEELDPIVTPSFLSDSAATNLKLIAKLAKSAKSFLFSLIYTCVSSRQKFHSAWPNISYFVMVTFKFIDIAKYKNLYINIKIKKCLLNNFFLIKIFPRYTLINYDIKIHYRK